MVSGVESQKVSVSVQDERLRKLRESVQLKYNPGIEDILKLARAVADYYGVSFEEMIPRTHSPRLAWPRMVVYYLARKRKMGSAIKIGKAMLRSTSAVFQGADRVQERINREPVIRAQIELLEQHV